MSIQIYKTDGKVGAISSDGTFSNPIVVSATQDGVTFERLYYIAMIDGQEYGSDCVLSAVDGSGDDESSWIQFAAPDGSGPGTYGDTFEFSVAQGEEVPVWIRIIVPELQEIGTKSDLGLRVSYIRHQS